MTVYIAMPVYKGWDFIDETIRSILAQTFTDYRVMISVDGDDKRSAEVCRRYVNDDRFELVVQSKQLGWAGNFNWLIDRANGPFFIYWQQDDFADTSYLQRLHAHLLAHNEAAIAYADVQWFGSRIDRLDHPSVCGTPLDRLQAQIESFAWIPFRGLVRREALEAARPIQLTSLGDGTDSPFEDSLFCARASMRGELHRVPGTLYFKRAHGSNTSMGMYRWPREKCRRAWVACTAGLYRIAEPLLVDAAERRAMILRIVERMITERRGRWTYWLPVDDAERRVFVEEVRAAIDADISADEIIGVLPGLRADQSGLERELRAASRDVYTVRFGSGEAAVELLGAGWSQPEGWGVWNDGRCADVRVPLDPGGERWTVTVCGKVHGAQRIVARAGADELGAWMFEADDARLELQIDFARVRHGACVISFDFPLARPVDGDDVRTLAFAMISIQVRRRS